MRLVAISANSAPVMCGAGTVTNGDVVPRTEGPNRARKILGWKVYFIPPMHRAQHTIEC